MRDFGPAYDGFGSFTTGWNHQRVQPRPLCSNRYRNGEPLKLTRRANNGSVARPHSITSSAVESSLSGTVRPNAFAILRLITNSNVVGCSTGKSAGLAPRRILST
jgi:hypothetical protein